MNGKYGFQIWKANDLENTLKQWYGEVKESQTEYGNINRFTRQPTAESFTKVFEEVSENEDLLTPTAIGYPCSIWGVADNYKKIKAREGVEFVEGDILVIKLFTKDDELLNHCVFLYGGNSTVDREYKMYSFNLLRDYEPVRESWNKAVCNF